MKASEWMVVADLIYLSHNYWCVSNGFPEFFTTGPKQTLLFVEIYEELDPGCCVVAKNSKTGRIAGACFYRERDTHFALGVMSVHPNYSKQGVERAMVNFICHIAAHANKPIRLLSPATNIDVFLLYTRAGFEINQAYQDLILPVPFNGVKATTPLSERVRPATLADLDLIASVELEVSSISRTRDYNYFLKNKSGLWHVSMIDDAEGGIGGYLVSLRHQYFNTIGPGVARSDDEAIALLVAELNVNAGRTPLFLIPVERTALVKQVCNWSARNFDITFT